MAKRDAAGVPQIVYYDQGVGTGNTIDRVTGGAIGKGLDDNIYDAYRFLDLQLRARRRAVLFRLQPRRLHGAQRRRHGAKVRHPGREVRPAIQPCDRALPRRGEADRRRAGRFPDALLLLRQCRPGGEVHRRLGHRRRARHPGARTEVVHARRSTQFHDTELSAAPSPTPATRSPSTSTASPSSRRSGSTSPRQGSTSSRCGSAARTATSAADTNEKRNPAAPRRRRGSSRSSLTSRSRG